jgi:hypothetical protein
MVKRLGRTWGGDIMRGEHPDLTRPRAQGRRGNGEGTEPDQTVRREGEADPLGGPHAASEFELSPPHNFTPTDPPPINQNQTENSHGGTSIFDPVLAELAYRWFCPRAGRVLDPFAGGSVRGLVASRLGLFYCGIDLSEGQLEANRAQAGRI